MQMTTDARAWLDVRRGVGGDPELAFTAWLLVKGARVGASKVPVPAT